MTNDPPKAPPSVCEHYWRKCTTCKRPINYESTFWVCSVSTCNRKRSGMLFCSLECFDAHLPVMRHRDAGAFERRAPKKTDVEKQLAAEINQPQNKQKTNAPYIPSAQKSTQQNPAQSSTPQNSAQTNAPQSSAQTSVKTNYLPPLIKKQTPQNVDQDILVVVSKLKNYITNKSGLNTSDSVKYILSDKIRLIADSAIILARGSERKTVMDRDIK